MSEIISENSFLVKSYINIVQKRIVERFGPYLRKKLKGGFPIVFPKMDLADVVFLILNSSRGLIGDAVLCAPGLLMTQVFEKQPWL